MKYTDDELLAELEKRRNGGESPEEAGNWLLSNNIPIDQIMRVIKRGSDMLKEGL